MKFTIVENNCPIAYPSWRMVMRVKHFGKQLSWCNRGSQWSAGRGPMWQPCQGSLAHKFEVLFLSPRYRLISHTQFHVVRLWHKSSGFSAPIAQGKLLLKTSLHVYLKLVLCWGKNPQTAQQGLGFWNAWAIWQWHWGRNFHGTNVS